MLKISSPNEKREVKIAWIELETGVGNFIIQPEHAPMILTLKPLSHVVYRLHNGKEEMHAVVTGVAHITRNSIALLLSE